MSRRQFVVGMGATGLGLLAGCGAASSPIQRPTSMPRVGFLAPSTIVTLPSLQDALRALGYVDGQNTAIEYRDVADEPAALQDAAAELIRLPVDLLLAVGTPASQAAKQATATLPIVIANVSDPVGAELVSSLARPGGNVTGMTNFSARLSGKRLELLRDALPGVARVSVLWNPANSAALQQFEETKAAGAVLGLEIQSREVSTAGDLAAAAEAAVKEGAGALAVLSGGFVVRHRGEIIDLAAARRLPTIYPEPHFAHAGGLMAMGPSSREIWARVASYVDRILKGAKPADLPVEQPMTFDFVVNLKTARQLGIMFPNEIMLQVTEVVQ
jgi:putative tryptophan/tyrosine transport system substrate-binding protein